MKWVFEKRLIPVELRRLSDFSDGPSICGWVRQGCKVGAPHSYISVVHPFFLHPIKHFHTGHLGFDPLKQVTLEFQMRFHGCAKYVAKLLNIRNSEGMGDGFSPQTQVHCVRPSFRACWPLCRSFLGTIPRTEVTGLAPKSQCIELLPDVGELTVIAPEACRELDSVRYPPDSSIRVSSQLGPPVPPFLNGG